MIAVYKLTESAGLTGGEVIEKHVDHARNHNGRVQFTTGKAPAKKNWHHINQLLVMIPGGRIAMICDVAALGSNSSGRTPASDFKQPSEWHDDDNDFWYALENVSEIQVTPGQFVDASGLDVLDKLSGRSSFAYAV